MSTQIRVRDGVAHISSGGSDEPGAPFLTAIVEAAGALLHWDATAEVSSPHADIDDIAAASGWLADIYGPAVAHAASAGVDAAIPVAPGDASVVDAVLLLGHVTWARAWWPAGTRIPALDPALLGVEIALTSHAVSHLLDDEDAVERALTDAVDAASALSGLPAALLSDGAEVAAAFATLAEDHGVDLLPVSATREDWALAAGGSAEVHAGIELATGTAAVRWADVPAQTVDADGEARWSLRQHAGQVTLHVEVPAVERATVDALRASFGRAGSEVDIVLERQDDRFAGETEAPASVVFLPTQERSLWVRDPMLAPTPGEPESTEERERVVRFAARRLSDPLASLAERAAGAAR